MTAQTPPLGEAIPPIEWDVLARYLAGECAAEEAEPVRRWLDAHPDDAALVLALDGALDRLAIRPVAEIDVEEALQRVAARRDAPDVRPLRPAAPRPARTGWSAWRTPMLRAAAVVGVAAAGALAWRASHRAGASLGEAGVRTYATGVGQRDSVRLPDGSRVVLGPASRLVVAADYGQPARQVELRGEGWFDVRHDDAHTFTVRAGAATIRDVGTTFTVRTEDDARVRVAVSSGAVLLDAAGRSEDAGRGVVLHQGDVGVLRADGRALAQPGGATGDDEAWTRGRLVFREAPLDEVRTALRRWYGLELRAGDSVIASRHLTAAFDGEAPDRVVEVIALALGAHAERHGDTVTVRRP